jgi:peptidoglycan/LPS O-acetylase OafA/YrhL
MGAPLTGQAAPRRVDAIDGFRAYAIIGVVTLHLLGVAGALGQSTTGSQIAWGLLGNVIDAFFIVSGFGLFFGLVARGGELGSLRAFAAGRAARLMPPYWITLAVMLVLLALVPSVGPGLPSIPNLAVHSVAMQMPARLFDSNVAIGFGTNGALWMISVIACFSLVFPLIARPYYRHPLIGLAIAAAIAFGWREAVNHLPGLLAALNAGDQPTWIMQLVANDQLPGWAFSFALGMTAAWAYHRIPTGSPAIRRRAVWICAGSLVACLVCAYLYGRHAAAVSGAIGGSVARTSPVLDLAYTLSRGVLMASIALAPAWIQAPFVNRATRSVADYSYGIYLIHLVVVIYVGASLLSLPADGSAAAVLLWFGIVLPLSFGYAFLVRRFAEQPARDWAKRAARPPVHQEVRTAAGLPG